MMFPLELNGDPGKHNRMLVRTSPKKIPTADMLTGVAKDGLQAWTTNRFSLESAAAVLTV